MSSIPIRNVALTQKLEAYIRAHVASAWHSGSSEMVRSGRCFLIEHDDARIKAGLHYAR